MEIKFTSQSAFVGNFLIGLFVLDFANLGLNFFKCGEKLQVKTAKCGEKLHYFYNCSSDCVAKYKLNVEMNFTLNFLIVEMIFLWSIV